MNILITGASGYIGGLLLQSLQDKKYNIIGTSFSQEVNNNLCKEVNIDLTDKEEVKRLLKENNFDVVFHFAAYISPALNELNPVESRLYNVEITKNIVNNLSYNCHLVFLSTDKVFDGVENNPDEESETYPCCRYGSMKREAEILIEKNIKKYHIYRLPIVHSEGDYRSSSFIDKAIIDVIGKNDISIYENIVRCFVSSVELVDLLNFTINNTDYGLYHVGTDSMSYYERLIQILSKNNVEYESFISKEVGKIQPVRQNLNVNKIFKFFGARFT